MIIQHNIPALNSYNKLSANNSALAKNLEKLSSGFKINRAGDDAAGLAISEKMRAQITGLETATKNAKDGVSLIQTAEGALVEVHSILNRLVELASQSANGIYENATDRRYIQEEVDELLDEVNRISKTDFNGIELLNGTLGGFKNNAVLPTGGTDPISGTGVTGISISGLTAAQIDSMGELSFKAGGAGQQALSTLVATNDSYGGLATGTATWKLVSNTGNGTGGSLTYELSFNENLLTTDAQKELAAELRGATVTIEHGALLATTNAGKVDTTGTVAGSGLFSGGDLRLQIGDKRDQTMTVSVRDMSSRGLGINNLSVGTQDLANAAIDTIKDAIDLVNLQRDQLGAKQNRLEHTINNLTETTANITDAEARIRDTDMALEMMKYTKNNILMQSAQAMLAQANQLPSSVLNLLY